METIKDLDISAGRAGLADLTHMSRKTKEIIRAAGLRDELTFTSFRHGDTEAADADLSDAEIRAQGRRKSAKVLPRYAKRTCGRSRPARRNAAQRERKQTIVRMGDSLLVRMTPRGCRKCFKTLERVKGIEPSSSIWKAFRNERAPTPSDLAVSPAER